MTEELVFVTPWFEDGHLIEQMVIKREEEGIGISAITRFYAKRNIKHRDAIFRLDESGARVYLNKVLHAKMFIFDSKTLILCSSNLIGTSLFRNHEVGIVSTEPVLVRNALDYCSWLKQNSHLFRPRRISRYQRPKRQKSRVRPSYPTTNRSP